MFETPRYVMVGRGRWARNMTRILEAENRVVIDFGDPRQQGLSRVSEAFARTESQIAWICLAPGPHVLAMVEAALEAGLHVVVEKPWRGSSSDTERLSV